LIIRVYPLILKICRDCLKNAVDQHHLNPDYNFYYDIGPIQSKDNWAWVYAVEKDKVSNEVISGEPRLLLGKFNNGSWNVVLPEFGDLYNNS
jgi:hypothetical protein